MKKLFALIAVLGMLTIGASSMLVAQENEAETTETTETTGFYEEESTPAEAFADEPPVQSTSLHTAIKVKFIEGGALFMSFVVLALIFGLAVAIERVIYLNLSQINTQKFLDKISDALDNGGIESAMEISKNTRGPVASVFYQGLSRYDQGLDMAEKSIASYGSVQMGLLEKGMSWIALFIAISPMLGFLGTVIGMIEAFDNIQAAGDIQPSLVAGGIKVALITTVGGLIAAMILQVFYNYCISKIEALVTDMEDSSVSLMDMLLKYQETHK